MALNIKFVNLTFFITAVNNITVTLMKSEAKNISAVVGVFAKLQEKDNPKLEPLVISVVEFQAEGKNK